MKKIIFYCFTVLAFLTTSCSKDDIAINLSGGWGGWNIPTFNWSDFDTSAIQYIKLPAKRYYIYKDPLLGTTDSVVVTQSTDSSAFQTAGPGYPFTYIYSIYKLTLTSFTTTTNTIWYTGTALCDFPAGYVLPTSGTAKIMDSNFILAGAPGSLPAFWHPFVTNGMNQYTYIPSLTIEGFNYAAVHKFFTTNGLQPTDINYTSAEFCWVKGIGIIKKEIRTYNSIKTSLLIRYG